MNSMKKGLKTSLEKMLILSKHYTVIYSLKTNILCIYIMYIHIVYVYLYNVNVEFQQLENKFTLKC